ncbi:2'-5' RNA ligase family protein [Haloarcula salinisoli]|uniref:2'-5' RNA ligase family protein n=1 Tax=Haloarcula salinisoli TaxID=2487746 RepID=A0A8J8C860_9EURY|nr:2'-5' RNA ligase family protein [Halomicroarcula salinisoli]MBX0286735.1 2'-5' RNA ligase family protein [Halomicroarcula salinisoli]MBX0304046.1 2'-5' RNA ligase family protein [Halomicroarcula salinisoli]
MYSLNVSLPSSVTRLAGQLARELPRARARPRGEHTLVVKRLGDGDHAAYARLEARARDAVRGTAPFEVRVTGVDCFETAETGPSPVVYLAVESPALRALHGRFCDEFDPVEGMEGLDDYVPHVTIARGGDPAAARRLVERDIDPVTWTVEELVFFDAERGQPVSRVSLPA